VKDKISPRYLHAFIRQFLDRKMVFLGGPRQVGKTTTCLQLLDLFDSGKAMRVDIVAGDGAVKDARVVLKDDFGALIFLQDSRPTKRLGGAFH